MSEIIVDVAFLRYGKNAPKNSGFKAKVNGDSLFGGFTSYTNREEAVKNSVMKEVSDETDASVFVTGRNAPEAQNGSFTGYTSRGYATAMSSETEYFTASNEGKLFTEEDRNRWIRNSKDSFSKPGDLAWTVVVSLENYDLLNDYGIRDQNDFAKITQVALYKACTKMHLDYSNLVWWEDYHTNTAHPHMHITFMEKEHTRDRGKFTKKEIDGLKETFYTELAARKRYREYFGNEAEQDLKRLPQLRENVVKAAENLNYESIQNIISLYAQLPRTGRLQYGSANMNPYREQLDSIVNDLLNSDGVKAAYTDFCTTAKRFSDTVNKIGNSDVSGFFDSQQEKLKKQIANSILQGLKTYREKKDIDNQHDWKLDHSPDLLIKDLEKLDESNLSEQDSELYKAIVTMDEERLSSLLTVNSEQNTSGAFRPRTAQDNSMYEYLVGAALIMRNANDKTDDRSASERGIEHIYHAAEHGCTEAKHYMNYYRQRFNVSKTTFHHIRDTLVPHFSRQAKRAVRQQKKEVEDEIKEFLKSLVSDGSDDAEYAKQFLTKGEDLS